MTVLVTGGNGYIGSHTVVALIDAGYDVVVMDNLANSYPGALEAVRSITQQDVRFENADVRSAAALDAIFSRYEIDAVIHFAALKSVADSAVDPIGYYETNVSGLVTLVRCMQTHQVRDLVFSSSAAVYGDCLDPPIDEDRQLEPTSPYGRTKAMAESLLTDLAASAPGWNITMLRYFNAVGAHASGQLGESPRGIPHNLLPSIGRVALGVDDGLVVNGTDYDTPDGSCIRDYIHVQDLANGHLHALQGMRRDLSPRATSASDSAASEMRTFNLGCGRGYSVLETIQAFERVARRPIPYTVNARRPGDIPESVSDASRAEQELGWRAAFDIDAMCADTWRWMQRHPRGYGD